MSDRMERIIGEYTGKEKGPLILVFSGMHGNEPAGVRALQTIFQLLEEEPSNNPSFSFKGKMLGLCGNLQAFALKKRFIKRDLNRQWTLENIARVKQSSKEKLAFEDLELREIVDLVNEQIEIYQPAQVVVLDLHTTSANGGIFTIATSDPESLRIAKEMHAPVITGLLKGLVGTTLHFFHSANFETPMVPVTFEAGHHEDPLSPKRAIAAIINLLRSVNCVRAEDVENRHDELLINYSKGLPKVATLVESHRIKKGDKFMMKPGYENFQPIKKGEILASDRHGEIRALVDSQILMPLYQPQGNDGFFLIKPLE